jgi:hypothetical protein
MILDQSIATLEVSDPMIAGRLIDAIGEAGKALANCLPAIEDSVLRDKVAGAVATVLGMDMHDLLMVLLRQHPDLDTHGILTPSLREMN